MAGQGQRIIIPKGSIRAEETNVIEIPVHLQNSSVVVAQPKEAPPEEPAMEGPPAQLPAPRARRPSQQGQPSPQRPQTPMVPQMEIEKTLGILRTPVQCESRFKTIMKRKSLVTTENKKSGNVRMSLQYEAEISKIKGIDDSIEPEILMDITHTTKSMKSNSENLNERSQPSTLKYDPGMKKKKKTLIDVMLSIHKEKEENKERRHKEKLALLENYVGNKKIKSPPKRFDLSESVQSGMSWGDDSRSPNTTPYAQFAVEAANRGKEMAASTPNTTFLQDNSDWMMSPPVSDYDDGRDYYKPHVKLNWPDGTQTRRRLEGTRGTPVPPSTATEEKMKLLDQMEFVEQDQLMDDLRNYQKTRRRLVYDVVNMSSLIETPVD
nr:unnamed protein product [Callosobruchus analis]